MSFDVTCLNDVSSVDSRRLDVRFFQSQPNLISKNTLDWPTKYQTNRLDMSKWRNLLRAIFIGDNKLLPTPMGK